MKKCIRILSLAMAMLMLGGCGGNKKAVSPQPPGTLAAIEYGRRVDMVWGENFSVRVAPEEIVFIDYFVEEDRDYRFESGITLEAGQWKQLETAALELLPGLTEIKPKKKPCGSGFSKKRSPSCWTVPIPRHFPLTGKQRKERCLSAITGNMTIRRHSS